MNALELSNQITTFVTERVEAIVTRFLPGFTIPGFFCGYRRTGFSEGPDLIYTLAQLHTLGVKTIAGIPVRDAISKLLRGVDGATTDTFYSYFVAESVLAFGPFKDNPLTVDFTETELENLRAAFDTTAIYDPEKKNLRGYSNNYWAVLARCEFARKQLGVLEDETLLQVALENLRKWIFLNPAGFFDDDYDGNGRFDIYSADVQLFCEPFSHLLESGKMEHNLRQHVLLLENMALENGASYAYGRSTGALSVCLTMEFAAASLEKKMAADPARSLSLVRHAFEAFRGWFEDDLINAHRHRSTEGYRSIHRLLQMTVNCLEKLCYAVEKLRLCGPVEESDATVLFPPVDTFTSFDNQNAGLWTFRNEHLTFQLPLVDGYNADYVAWPRSPGLLENPVDSPIFCGVPRIALGAFEYTAVGRPARVEKNADSLTFTREGFKCVSGQKDARPFRGTQTVTWRLDGDTLVWDEHLVFEETPGAVSYYIPETARPLNVTVDSEQQFHHDTIAVSGMAGWRSCWSEAQNVHQIHFTPSREIRFSIRITPKLRVRVIPPDHDYTRALYDVMRPGFLIKHPRPAESAMSVKSMAGGIDIFHIGWPEYLFAAPQKDTDKFDADYLDFIGDMGKSGVKTVWTMHNRRPHHMDATRGRALYQAWARIADGVIHHSHWGMQLMRSELPFRQEAKHVVIAHGHFGAQMPQTRPRAEIETALGLAPCAMRFCVPGRWQKEKQIGMIIEAFVKAGRPDQQLLVIAHKPDMPKPDDPRVIFLPRKEWMSREEITESTRVCDALVTAHMGDTYLTSGISADAVGVGIPMFAPRWEFFRETLGDAPFYHDNTPDSLAAAFASVTLADMERGKAAFTALQPASAWPLLAEKTLAFFRSLGRR